jgi:hypothetical protein
LKRPNLLVIITLISFLSIILVTGSPFKSSTNSFDYNNPILLDIPSIQAQDDGDGFEGDDGGDDDFAGFEEENNADNEEVIEDTPQIMFESEGETEDQENEEVEEETEDQENEEVEEETDEESEQETIDIDGDQQR